jgi:hypothetical protein
MRSLFTRVREYQTFFSVLRARTLRVQEQIELERKKKEEEDRIRRQEEEERRV